VCSLIRRIAWLISPGGRADGIRTIVNNNGYIRYADTPVSPSYATCTFTGLNPSKLYSVVLTGARGNSAYTARHTIFQISDVDAFTNASSTGATFSGPVDPTVEFQHGLQHKREHGLCRSFTNVRPAATVTWW